MRLSEALKLDKGAIIQECIDAITAEGVRVSEGSNESWRQGMFYAADVLRKLKAKE